MNQRIVIGKGAGVKLDGDRLGLAWLQEDLAKALKLLFRPVGRPLGGAYIDLEGLRTGAAAGVGDGDLEGKAFALMQRAA